MLKFLPIMLLSSAKNVAYYAQYYTHKYCNYATVHKLFIILWELDYHSYLHSKNL